MKNENLLEQRLAVLEKEVAELKRQIATPSVNGNWLDQFMGSVTDHEAFDRALEYGRAFRESDRPADEPGDET